MTRAEENKRKLASFMDAQGNPRWGLVINRSGSPSYMAHLLRSGISITACGLRGPSRLIQDEVEEQFKCTGCKRVLKQLQEAS